jgi:purine-binding chemotaxis protein CheW
MRALLMPLGDDWYAVETDCVREATTDLRPTRIPGAPSEVLGVINIRGEVIPLFDTAALLGLGIEATTDFAVVVQSPSGPAALTATGMPEVVTLEDELGPSDLQGGLARYRLDTRLVVTLDPDALLATARGDAAAGAP